MVSATDANENKTWIDFKAEALTVRALSHMKHTFTRFEKWWCFAAVLVTRIVTSAEEPMQRTNNGAFYASIHSDLDAALALLFNGGYFITLCWAYC
jgi:hypothetical protein